MTAVLLTVAEISAAMAVIIALLLLLLRLFGKRFFAKCRYIVWAVVIVRLCIPFGAAGLTGKKQRNL